MKHPGYSNSLPLIAAALVMLTAGCGRDGVKVYKVDSDDTTVTPPPAAAAPAEMPAAMPSTMPAGLPTPDNSGLPKLKYTVPAGWTEKTATQMRVASFEINEGGKTVDVSVIPLGPMAGTDAANITRWLGQVGQPPVDDAGVQKMAVAVQVGDQPANLYDLSGTSPGSGDKERVIGAILHTDIATWFFKMMGDSDLAEKNKPAFIAFLKSMEFEKIAAPSTMDVNQLPPTHPAIPGVTTGVAAATEDDLPALTVPAGWTPAEPPQFVLIKFNIAGPGDATAAATVSKSGGTLLANLNRWRGQLGQPAITDDDAAKLPTVDVSGVKAVVADFTGTDARTGKPSRLVGVVLPLNGQTWFYKLMGDPALVAQQKDTFTGFVQSAKYPAAK